MLHTEPTQEMAAAKAGVDVKTARKYLRTRRLPSEQKVEQHWRRRQDGFSDVWPEIAERLSTNPGLEAKKLFAALQREHPERFVDGQLRTLQRRIKHWRASEGPAQEVYFVQEHRAGSFVSPGEEDPDQGRGPRRTDGHSVWLDGISVTDIVSEHGEEEHGASSTDSRGAAHPAGAFDGGAARVRDHETGAGGLAGQGEDGPGDAVWLDGADDGGRVDPGKR